MPKFEFYYGQVFERDGVRYSVRSGNRCKGDLVIVFEVLRPGPHMPTIAHNLILLAFKSQVEEHNYGPMGMVKRGRGKFKLAEVVRNVVNDGDWEAEAEKIAFERVNKWWDK